MMKREVESTFVTLCRVLFDEHTNDWKLSDANLRDRLAGLANTAYDQLSDAQIKQLSQDFAVAWFIERIKDRSL